MYGSHYLSVPFALALPPPCFVLCQWGEQQIPALCWPSLSTFRQVPHTEFLLSDTSAPFPWLDADGYGSLSNSCHLLLMTVLVS